MAERSRRFLFVVLVTCCTIGSAYKLPVFINDMNNFPLSEETPVGAKVFTLLGQDPDGLPIKYSLKYTDQFVVNSTTGDVSLAKPLDREVKDTIKFEVSIEAQDPETTHSLVQTQAVTVIVLDENDNPPVFRDTPYEINVPEDEVVGTTILRNIRVDDRDSVGDNLEVGCLPNKQWPDACSIFEVVSVNSSVNHYFGALVLKKPLDYNDKQFYQFQLLATDGVLNSTAHVEVKVVDVQNSPPVFSGSFTAALSEGTNVGTVVLTVTARDADKAAPRDVILELITNPLDFFVLDSITGELKTAKPLDREALADPSSPLNLTVRATEIVNGAPLISNLTSTTATITITLIDVNDERPRFNRNEYSVQIPESLPVGTPLPNLDMVVTDTDVGSNSEFTLRLYNDFGAFVLEPLKATGSASVTIRLNSSLDYEDPNQRKFILEVVAEDAHLPSKLFSKASVTVSLTDVNDNAPQFADDPYSATVSESAIDDITWITQITATDRDTGRFGTEGIVYQLSGNGAELFWVDNSTGFITVASCPTPGQAPCLDYETTKEYHLQYKAIDDYGNGLSSVASLKISVTDANDNPPVFQTPVIKASIDEDALTFEPELKVRARDLDASSEIRYYIVDPEKHNFLIDALSGRISVNPNAEEVLNADNDKTILTVLATDGVHNATCKVEITIRDVNNHAPVFNLPKYDASVLEDAPIGYQVTIVGATDDDSGVNSEIKYSIQKGAYDSFAIDNTTGVVTISSQLDYDKRKTYQIQIIATDSGMPSLTGTTELVIDVLDVNDKLPYFKPSLQRAEVWADAPLGKVVHTLVAEDPDIADKEQLLFNLSTKEVIKAVDKNGKEVTDEGIFGSWFTVHPDGTVSVSQKLDRTRAAVLTLPVTVVDASAPNLQQGEGNLIITIVDVNHHAPVFSQLSYTERLLEEQPIGTVLQTYTATDKETPISAIVIYPPSPYFEIDNVTGVVKTTKRIDYEKIHSINFTLVAFDSGVPQLSSSANVTVEVVNWNDEEPKFLFDSYKASVVENSPAGTSVVIVQADDGDEGDFGQVRYSLSGNSTMFVMNPETGEVTVAPGAKIDREVNADFWLTAIASDNAPGNLNKSTSVQIYVKVEDLNDNPPVFSQKSYISSITENIQLKPPTYILQVQAEDKDEGINREVKYRIEEQNEPGTFRIDPFEGIIYPVKTVKGNTTYHINVSATDELGAGPHTVYTNVDITVLSVNSHSPVFISPAPDLRVIEIPENAAQSDYLITTFLATDEDRGENGRVNYYLKVDNMNVGETQEFSLDKETGELRTKTFLDREHIAEYELVISAVDNGSPSHETLKVITVVITDEDDNIPHFQKHHYHFSVLENRPPQIVIGTVKATDKDAGENGQVYYHILDGNRDGAFTVGKTSGVIVANITFDRETRAEYSFTIHASNNPLLAKASELFNAIYNSTEVHSDVTVVSVKVLDQNDNAPKFQRKTYYAGVTYTARVNEPILSVEADDPDLDENSTLVYMVAASNLYKFGASESSGSVVPSPFNISQDGVIMTASYMSEYNQDRFVLDIIAKEIAPPYREAKTQVYIWIIDRSSLIRIVVSRSCSTPLPVLDRLASASQMLLIPGRRQHLVQAERLFDEWCEIHLHAVDPSTYQVLPVEKALESIDSKYDDLKDLYHEFGVENLIPVSATSKAPDSFDPALAALIALLIVLFTGIVTFIVVCACLKHWVIPPPSMQSSKGDSLARRRILEELSTTENPLWLETKLRPYEEQELTMNVFGDQNEPVITLPATDNTYATIQGSRANERFGDYATLGGESPTPMEAALGFQGSTFKPRSRDTPEPPPRPSAGLGQL